MHAYVQGKKPHSECTDSSVNGLCDFMQQVCITHTKGVTMHLSGPIHTRTQCKRAGFLQYPCGLLQGSLQLTNTPKRNAFARTESRGTKQCGCTFQKEAHSLLLARRDFIPKINGAEITTQRTACAAHRNCTVFLCDLRTAVV